jgi:hypothetical protein
MFLCPPRPEGAEGVTDDKPIPLPGVTRYEFKALLDYFYNGSVTIFLIDSTKVNVST